MAVEQSGEHSWSRVGRNVCDEHKWQDWGVGKWLQANVSSRKAELGEKCEMCVEPCCLEKESCYWHAQVAFPRKLDRRIY